MYEAKEAAQVAPPPVAAAPQSLLATMQAQGWRVSPRVSNGWHTLTNGTKTAAISEDGAVVKMFSTTMCESPGEGAGGVKSAPTEPPISVAQLAARAPELGEPVLNFCRRGSFALVAGDPKAGKTTLALKICAKKAQEGYRTLYADFENGPALFLHRLKNLNMDLMNIGERLQYLDCRDAPTADHIAEAIRSLGGADLVVIDCWGLLIGRDGVEDESSNALISQYFMRIRRLFAPFNAAVVILHHTPKSGASEKLCFAGAGASSLQRYVQTIARISEDKNGAWWFNAVCREIDEPFKPVMLRRS